jgi:basic membrane protein A
LSGVLEAHNDILLSNILKTTGFHMLLPTLLLNNKTRSLSMNKKVIPFGIILLLISILLSACGVATAKPKVALMLARGGLGDQAFNDSANSGLQKAAGELGAETKTFDYQDGDPQLEAMRQAARDGYNPLIALGSENAQAITTVAEEFPKTGFVIIDTTAQGANVTSVTFSELEGDFLAGALAALLSPNGKVGYLGGADVTVIRRIEFGFKQGVLYVNPQAQVDSQFIGGKDDFSGFAKPDVGKELAAHMYAGGDDVVYAAAGGSALGAIEAASAARKPIITTGSDQRWIAPEVVVTSRTKNMDDAVFTVIQQFSQGKLQPGNITLDYKSGGIGLAPISQDLVSADILAKFEQIRSDLEAGKITIQPFTTQ